MIGIEGKYELQKNENLLEFLLLLGPEVSNDLAKKLNDAPSSVTVSVEDGKYNFDFEIGPMSYTIAFRDGDTFEDEILPGLKVQNVATVTENLISLKSTFKDDRSGERIYEFTDHGLTVLYSSSNTSFIGKRIYKKI